MQINFTKLQVGDVFFTRANTPISWLICLFTSSKVSHVGQLNIPFGKLFYRAEMVLDTKGDQDFKITAPLNEKEIVSIKRPIGAYITETARECFQRRMINWHETMTIDYDVKELLSHIPIIGSQKDKEKDKMICSRLVYSNLVMDGCPIKSKFYDAKVSPADLFNSPFLKEVEGWKIK